MGPMKVARIRRETGLPVVHVLVRGGTNHRRDLCLTDGSIKHLWPDGSVTEPEWAAKWTSPTSPVEMGASDEYFTTVWQAGCPVPAWGERFTVKRDEWVEHEDGTFTRIILEAGVWPNE